MKHFLITIICMGVINTADNGNSKKVRNAYDTFTSIINSQNQPIPQQPLQQPTPVGIKRKKSDMDEHNLPTTIRFEN